MEDETREIVTSGNAKILPPEIEETGADSELVSTAVNQIKELYCSHVTDAMLEIGKYLIREFFNDDLARAKQKKAVKEKSLFQVITELKGKGEQHPSKSWIYNAINLVVDCENLRDFQSYGKLPLSSKVLLLHVKDEALKKTLADEAISDSLSVSQLRERISKKKGDKEIGLLRLLKKEKYMADCNIKGLFSEFKIQELSDKKLLKVREAIQNEIDEIEATINNKKTLLKKYQDIKNKIEKGSEKES